MFLLGKGATTLGEKRARKLTMASRELKNKRETGQTETATHSKREREKKREREGEYKVVGKSPQSKVKETSDGKLKCDL